MSILLNFRKLKMFYTLNQLKHGLRILILSYIERIRISKVLIEQKGVYGLLYSKSRSS